MSDRYRPPSGPKGPRGVPPLSRTGNGVSSSSHYHDQTGAQRSRDRDIHRSAVTNKSNSTVGPGLARPSGPSGYRDSSSGASKRFHPDDRQTSSSTFQNKRREFGRRDLESKPRANGTDPSLRRSQINLTQAPRGPRMGNAPVKRIREIPRAHGNSYSGIEANPSKLRPNQVYSIYSVRTSDLYKRVQQVGEGTYGKVYKAKNEVTGEEVAIKKLRLETEREGFPITAMREIKLLQSFDHPNIVGLLEMMVEYNQITMVFDYLNHDLTGLLTLPDLTLTEGHRKMIFKQLITGLDYLHRMRVIHRDIKGSNILLNSQGILKIADFGLARNMKVLRNGESPDYTNRVITIWYRPPELLMGSADYGREVDIWGVGCLLIELYTRTAIFQGAEEISQLYKIYEVMGTPTAESWPGIENLPWFEMMKPQIKRSSRFEQDYRNQMTEDSFDLAQKMLSLHPGKRITAREALKHAYFYNDPQPEALTFIKDIVGEWHEFETKKRRREERKRLMDLKITKKAEIPIPASIPKSVNLYSPSFIPRSVSETPLENPGTTEYSSSQAHGSKDESTMVEKASEVGGNTEIQDGTNVSAPSPESKSVPIMDTATNSSLSKENPEIVAPEQNDENTNGIQKI